MDRGLGDIAWFFSKMAVVTVGGAYAVLAYVAQDAVEPYRWLSRLEMLAGLGLAETTPGPLILVLQFVGFLAGFPRAGSSSGTPGGVAAAADPMGHLRPVLCVRLPRRAADRAAAGEPGARRRACRDHGGGGRRRRQSRRLVRAARAVPRHAGGAVGPATLDVPVLGSIDPVAALLAMLAAVCLFRLKVGILKTLAITAVAGLVLQDALGWLLG